MATNRDLERLKLSYGTFPELIATLLNLDARHGLRRDGDYLLAETELAAYLFLSAVVIDDPEIRQVVDNGDEEEITRAYTARPFLVRFASPWGQDSTAIPDTLRGKVVLLRVMTVAEAKQLDAVAATVRGDGTVIELP